jgi:capsular exopolysaccharide synthesis family protein
VAEAQKEVAAIDKQLKDIDSANKSITTMVTVIEPATASDRPTSPRSTLILLLATIGGLCLGCGVAMVRDIRSGGVIEPGSLDQLKMLGDGLPVLARLPAVPRRQLAMNSWRDRMVDSAAEFSHACEQVHQALESITSFSGGRTVVVTSTKAREGKSTLASLLALTLAQTGNRVLLVDANLHSPVQGEIFGIDGDYGLGNLLEEEIESDFASCVHPGNDDRMDVLLSGASTAAFADLLNSQRFTDLLAAMAAEYDCVLIDSPALAAGPEARIIASSCDATLILANESGINKKVLKQTRDSLTSVGGNVIGVVLNGGMPAIGTVDAVVNIDVSHHAPVRPGVQVTAAGPARVTTPIPIPAPEPVQSVFAAQVRRVVDEEAEVSEPVLPEVESEVDRFGWIWSYSLVAILLLGAWMAFHGLWGASRIVGTLMSPAQEPLTMLMAGSGLLVAMLLAGFQVRPPRQDIALIVLGGILAAVTLNGGAINTLWSSQQHAAITSSTAQTILLFATLLFGWSVVRRTRMAGPLNIADPIVASDVALAVFAQASAMSAMMILLSHWHSKGECLAVIAFSSCLATMLAYWMAPLRSSLCFWLSPFAVALFGYLCAAASAQGIHVSMLMALARPMPLDYASMGTIGAMLGFWIARCAGRIAWPTG